MFTCPLLFHLEEVRCATGEIQLVPPGPRGHLLPPEARTDRVHILPLSGDQKPVLSPCRAGHIKQSEQLHSCRVSVRLNNRTTYKFPLVPIQLSSCVIVFNHIKELG